MAISNHGHNINDFFLDVSASKIPSAKTIDKFGFNKDIDTGGYETIWSQGGLWSPLFTGEVLNIASDDVNDTSAGTGARTVLVYGTDDNYNLVEETVILNGTSNVATVNAYTSVYRIAVITSGSGNINAGNITATAVTSATVQAHVPAGYGITQQMIFVVPAGYNAYINTIDFSAVKVAGSNPIITLQAKMQLENQTTQIFLEDTFDTAIRGDYLLKAKTSAAIPPKAYLSLQVTTDTNNTAVYGRGSLILRKI